MAKITNRLRVILAERNIRQIDMAETIGVSNKTLSNIVSQKYNTSLEVALKIADYLNVKVDDIFELDKEEKQNNT